MRIAVDGMGGDYAPEVAVAGAVQAANDFDYEVVIVGQEHALKKELQKHKVTGGKLFIENASQVVTMDEAPVHAIKKKKDSSIAIGVELLKNKEVDAFVSAGNTGAVVASSSLKLGYLPGISRPGIAISLPTIHGVSLVMDVGANIDPRPEHLFQYALMSEIYSKYMHKKKRPTVGLLNIGEEECKGTELMQETYKLLRDSEINFIGNIEGRDVFAGKSDCIICDGFVGNVMLKLVESIRETASTVFKRELKKSFLAKIGALLLIPSLKSLKKETDVSEFGGAPLLGVNGTVIISHGGSDVKSIKNAVKAAAQAVENDVNEHIVQEITKREQSNDA